MTPPRGILPRPIRKRYHQARHERPTENGATEGVFALDRDIRGQLRTPPEPEPVRDAETVWDAEPLAEAEPVGQPTPPPSSQNQPAARPRFPRRALSLAALVAAIVACAAVGIVLGSVVSSTGDRAVVTTTTLQAHPPVPARTPTQVRPERISLAPGGAFDPLGDGDEHADLVPLAVDGDPSTAWSSEDYRALDKAGVGFYVNAERRVSPTRLTLRTSTPGFALTVFGARGKRAPHSLHGWTKLGAKARATRKTSLALDGKRSRHLLLWITSLPPGAGAVKVSEVRLRA